MQATITAIVLTKNEEKNIISCLSSLSWCDEIIVIDDDSDDKTVELAKKHKATVYSHPMKKGFADQRNYALTLAHGEWIFFLDADERVPLPLHFEILGNITNSMQDFSGYSIRRVDTLWGRKMQFGETGNIRLLRLAKKSSGKWTGKVHEKWHVDGKIGILKNPIEHFPHQTITEFLREINTYTTIRAQELYDNKVKSSLSTIILFPLGKFLLNYIGKLGFRDGVQGLIVSLMMSFHSFLVRGKLWQLWVKESK